MATNQLLTSSMITNEALMILENDLTMTKAVNTQYSSEFKTTGAKIGMTANLRKPPRYLGRTGEQLQVEGSTESFVPVTLDTLAGVDLTFSTVDLARNINDFSEQFLKPALATVKNTIDFKLCSLYSDVFRIANCGASAVNYGTAGYLNDAVHNTLANVQSQAFTAGAILTETGVPQNQRAIVLDPMSQVSIMTPLTTIFNQTDKTKGMFEDATIGRGVMGFDWGVDANMLQFTPGTGGVSALTSAPTSGATTLACTTTAGVIAKGTIISMAGVFAINPQSRQSTGRLAQFVVTQDTTVTTTGTLPIYPAYIPSGQFATCIGTPSGTAAITVHTGAAGSGPYSQNLAFNKNAFALVSADQELPQGVHFASRSSSNGLSLRIVRQYDINSNQIPCRIEVLFGVKSIYPELAVRLGG